MLFPIRIADGDKLYTNSYKSIHGFHCTSKWGLGWGKTVFNERKTDLLQFASPTQNAPSLVETISITLGWRCLNVNSTWWCAQPSCGEWSTCSYCSDTSLLWYSLQLGFLRNCFYLRRLWSGISDFLGSYCYILWHRAGIFQQPQILSSVESRRYVGCRKDARNNDTGWFLGRFWLKRNLCGWQSRRPPPPPRNVASTGLEGLNKIPKIMLRF